MLESFNVTDISIGFADKCVLGTKGSKGRELPVNAKMEGSMPSEISFACRCRMRVSC